MVHDIFLNDNFFTSNSGGTGGGSETNYGHKNSFIYIPQKVPE